MFDKVRRDNQAPEAYGATVTYDIPLNRGRNPLYTEVEARRRDTEEFVRTGAIS